MKQTIKQLVEHEGFKRYALNTGWLLGEKFLRMGINFFVVVWMIRYLGPEQFGILSYAQSYVAIFAVLSTLGLETIVVKELVNEEFSRGDLLGTTIILRALGTLFMFMCLFLGSFFIEPASDYLGIILLIGISLALQVFYTFDFYFQAKVLAVYSSIAQSLGFILISFYKVYLIMSGADLIYFALAFSLEAFIIALTLYFLIRRQGHFFIKELKFNASIAKKIMTESWPLIFTSFLILVYMRVDTLIIATLLDIESVGIYGASVKLSEVWFSIPVVLASSLFPALINAKEKLDHQTYLFRLQRLFSFLIWSSILVAIPVTLFSEIIVVGLFGPGYIQSAEVLMIHFWSGIFVSMAVVTERWYVAEKLTILSLQRALIGCILNVILNFILIPIYGIKGAAFATLASYAVSTYFFDLFHLKTREIFALKTKAFLFKYNP